MSGTKVLACNCQHEQQDALYGKGNRLHNVSGKEEEAFCTVCSPSWRRNKATSDNEVKYGEKNPFNQTVSTYARKSRKGKKIKR